MKDGSSIHQRVLHYTHKGTDVLYCDFHISSDGYDNVQVEESRQQYGSNLLTGRAKDTVLHRLCRAFINPFTIILFFLAIISFVTDAYFEFRPGYDHRTAYSGHAAAQWNRTFYPGNAVKACGRPSGKFTSFQCNGTPGRQMDSSFFFRAGSWRYSPSLCRRPCPSRHPFDNDKRFIRITVGHFR